MKYLLILIPLKLLLAGNIFAQPDDQDPLTDERGTRLIELEDEVESLRRELTRELSRLEDDFSREHSVLKEYMDMFEADLSSLEARMEENEKEREQIREQNQELQEAISGIREAQDELQETIAGLQQSQEEIVSDYQETLNALADIERQQEQHSDVIRDFGDLEADLSGFNETISQVESSLEELSSRMETELEKQQEQVDQTQQDLENRLQDLSQKIGHTDQDIVTRLDRTDSRLETFEDLVEERTLYLGATTLGAVLLGLSGFVLGIFSRRRAKKLDQKSEEKNQELREEFQQQQAMLDSRLAELLEMQTALIPEPGQHPPDQERQKEAEAMDHSLAIHLGEELYKMIQRVRKLPPEDQATKELKSYISRLYKFFKQKGYDIVDLEGKHYTEDMEAKPEFVLTHEMLPGEQVVSRVKKPLIQYRGETIQEAEIEVLMGE